MAVSSSTAAAPIADYRQLKTVLPGRFVVKAKDASVWASAAKQEALAEALSGRHKVRFTVVRQVALGWLYLDVADLVDEAETMALAERLAMDEALEKAATDGLVRAQRLPSDPLLSFMWHLDTMRLPQAWDTTIGTGNTRMGVVDSGLIAHEDLSAENVGVDFVSDVGAANDGDGRDGNPTDACPEDSGFHGTHVAGTMAAQGDNGVGIVGANWRGKLVAVRALGCGGGSAVDTSEAALWLAGETIPGFQTIPANLRAKVINMSLGGGGGAPCDAFRADVYADLDRRGAIVVAAAGNAGGAVETPANCGGVLAVAASNIDNQLADYSCFGPEVDIVAPGGEVVTSDAEGILSTLTTDLSDFTDSSPYGFLQGTSMATPNVAGVISLLLDLDGSLTRAEVEAVLKQTGRPCSGCGSKVLIDAAAAVAMVASGQSIDVGPSCVNTCQFANDGECDDGRPGAISSVCDAGSDCNDCDGGGGGGGGGGSCTNTCQFAAMANVTTVGQGPSPKPAPPVPIAPIARVAVSPPAPMPTTAATSTTTASAMSLMAPRSAPTAPTSLTVAAVWSPAAAAAAVAATAATAAALKRIKPPRPSSAAAAAWGQAWCWPSCGVVVEGDSAEAESAARCAFSSC